MKSPPVPLPPMLQVAPASESSAKEIEVANIMKLREAKTQGKIERASKAIRERQAITDG